MRPVAFVVLAACSTPAPTYPHAPFDPAFDAKVRPLVGDTTDATEFHLHCPAGVVCDETFDYRAYTHETDTLYVMLSFDTKVMRARTLSEVRAAFSYVNASIRFPTLASPGHTFHSSTFGPLRDVQFEALDGRHLRGSFAMPIDDVVESIKAPGDPTCFMDDISGECAKSYGVKLRTRIRFELELE